MNPSPKRRLPLASALLVSMLAACGGSDDDDAPAPPPPVAAEPLSCDSTALAAVELDGATVTGAERIPAGSYTPQGSRTAFDDLPAFCRITAKATPTTASLIEFEVWVPEDPDWNGKMVVTGNGGYSPALSYRDMAYAMRQGYAVVGGDTGHQSSDPNEMFWGVGQPEKIRDWGSRSIHAITAPSRALVGGHKAQSPSRAYYYGCSTGGHQGFAEMQRYPEDFDGVIAGAPGHNRTRLNVEFLHRFQANRVPNTDTPTILSAAKARLITERAVAACDTIDGVPDGVIEDPRACTSDYFDVGSLQCTGVETDDCLTADQIEVARKIYAGPTNPRTGEQIYPGYPVGTEASWSGYWGSNAPVRADYWRLWVFDNPQWDWWSFDYDRDLAFADAKIGPLVDQTSTDLSAFKAAGGKAIVYHGWQDAVVNALDTIAYHDAVQAAQGGPQATQDFFRLFLAPGMGHCSGGAGPTVFGNSGIQAPNATADNDLLMALDRWVEQGQPPERIVAARVADNTVTRTRPLCPYPQKAVYKGSGSTDDAANFDCR